jgi:hypothetical protein
VGRDRIKIKGTVHMIFDGGIGGEMGIFEYKRVNIPASLLTLLL